jgi:hypothetical protein
MQVAFAAIVLISLASFATIAFLPTSSVHAGAEEPGVTTVILLQPTLAEINGRIALGGAGALLLIGLICVIRQAGVFALVALLSVLLCPLAGIIAFVRDPAPWRIYNELEAPDGTVYCFAESSFLQGQTLMLGRVRDETLFTRTIDALVVTNGDNPRSFLRIVRPLGAEDKYGQLYMTDDHWLLGLRSENRCFFAYDLKAEKAYGREAIEKLSPFLALGKSTLPHEPDVAAVLAMGIEGTLVGAPTREAIEQSLAHPNPRVRKIAAKLLEKR